MDAPCFLQINLREQCVFESIFIVKLFMPTEVICISKLTVQYAFFMNYASLLWDASFIKIVSIFKDLQST